MDFFAVLVCKILLWLGSSECLTAQWQSLTGVWKIRLGHGIFGNTINFR